MKSKIINLYDGRLTIYEDGRIFCKKQSLRSKGFFKKLTISKRGYSMVECRIKGIRKFYRVHRLLAEAFIPNPQDKPTVNHKDGNKLNNDLSNLEWATYKENNWHSRHILKNNHNTEKQRAAARVIMSIVGKKQGIKNRKLSEDDAAFLRKERETCQVSTSFLSKKYGISKTSVLRIINKKSYQV